MANYDGQGKQTASQKANTKTDFQRAKSIFDDGEESILVSEPDTDLWSH